MTGVEQYNKNLKRKADVLMKSNNYPFLKSFYNYLLIDCTYGTAYKYLQVACCFLNYLDIVTPRNISLDSYLSYMSSLKDHVASYRIVVYSGLRKFSSFLKAKGYGEDYMKDIKRPKFKESQKTIQKREGAYLNPEQIKELIDCVRSCRRNNVLSVRDMAIIQIFLNTGIRCSALTKLDINDIDLDNGVIYVSEKGEVPRELYLSDDAVNYVKEWLEYREIMLGLNTKNEIALFLSNRKIRISNANVHSIMKQYGEKMGIRLTPHMLRGTFGTNLYNETGDVYFVQEAMGHQSPKTTELYIRGQKKNMTKKAADLMGKLIN